MLTETQRIRRRLVRIVTVLLPRKDDHARVLDALAKYEGALAEDAREEAMEMAEAVEWAMDKDR